MDQLTKDKIEMWSKKLVDLKKELEQTMVERGEASRMGDLSENAAYKDATEKAEVLRVRIADMEKIIKDLKASSPKK